MSTATEIWACDDDRQQLWADDPGRAAFLAYLEVVALWHEQVVDGVYWGIPALHRLPSRPQPVSNSYECSTMRSRPPCYTRDSSAGQFEVPSEVRERWLAAAA